MASSSVETSSYESNIGGGAVVGDESVLSGMDMANGDASVDASAFLTRPDANTASQTGANGRHRQVKDRESQVAGPEEDLWGSILNSVKSSRAVPVKNIIMLGEPRTGKSTILSQLSTTAPSGFISHHHQTLEGASSAIAADSENTSPAIDGSQQQSFGPGAAAADLGLGYGYFDVGDDDTEDTIARVGVYQLSSSNPSLLSLLPFAVPPPPEALRTSASHAAEGSAAGSMGRSTKAKGADDFLFDPRPSPSIDALNDSLFLITLDWESPWTFLSQLVEWLDVIRETVEAAAGRSKGHSSGEWSKESVKLDELKERLEAYVRLYTEPSVPAGSAHGIAAGDDDVGNASAIIAVSNPALSGEDDIPLPEGCLTHNFGVPIVVVCTKADTISRLERDRNFKEEQFDYIQQVLRTICLKYGAGLFFTAQSRPPSYDILRSYILHRLFTPVSHLSSTNNSTIPANGFSSGTAGGAAPSSSTTFPFPYRASTVERDVLLVPTGWDSWGKIKALREGFDCAGMASGWEWDAEVERIRRRKRLPKGSREAEEATEQEVERRGRGEEGVGSAVRLYEDIVEDWESQPPLNTGTARTAEPDDQTFLAQHHSALQKDPDPKSKFARTGSLTSASAATVEPLSSPTHEEQGHLQSGRSVVGPMGSSSLSLPSVERVMQERQNMDDGLGGGGSGAGAISGRSSKSSRGTRDRERDRESGRSTPTLSHQGGVGQQRSSKENVGLGLGSPSLEGESRSSGNSRPTSPSGAPSPGGGTPKQSEVLHSFFQSLLKEKGPSGGGTPIMNRTSRGDRRGPGTPGGGGTS